jgi:hypothetical protein
MKADAGDRHAAWQLINVLAERGDLDGLRARVEAEDEYDGGRNMQPRSAPGLSATVRLM